LRVLAGAGAAVHRVAAPFACDTCAPGPPLPGQPAVVLLAGRGWLPSIDGARWFLRAVWPRVRARLPGARLHLFGIDRPPWRGQGVVHHAAPATSAEAFARDALMVVPLRIASGVRMKILEAWARGLPVVATPQAIAGLDARPGHELLVARDGDEFADALALLDGDAERRAALVREARTFLRARHDPATVAGQLTTIAEDVASAARARR
jgi:glycosyltransferase involved in cell wall biosynthesis